MATPNFIQLKKKIIADLGVVDYSPKGTVDKEIVPLINLVNNHPLLVTTSSCAGRVSVFIEGDKSGSESGSKIGGKGLGGHWLFFTHDPQELVRGKDWINGLKDYEHPEQIDPAAPRRYVLYKFEPFILHVKCNDLETARELFSLALSCGFRESGIGSNNVVAIRISMRIDAPIGYLKNRGIQSLVSTDYLHELDAMALELFEKNNRRISEITAKIEHMFKEKPVKESADERRERKRREGLEKQAQVKTQKSQAPQPTEQNQELELEPWML